VRLDVPERPIVRTSIQLGILAVDLYHREKLLEVSFLAHVLEVTGLALAEWADLFVRQPLRDTALAKDTNLTRVTELRLFQQAKLRTDNASEHVLDRLNIFQVSDPAAIFLFHLDELLLTRRGLV
jgi:hypothetical protein